MTDEHELIDAMPVEGLRALAHRQVDVIAGLLTERDSHLRGVEMAYTRRHNQQRDDIDKLERLVATLKQQITQRGKAS